MKVPALAVWIGLALMPGLPLRAIDFTPRPGTQVIDAYTIHFVTFADGARRVEYGPPAGWNCTGSGSQLTLLDPKNSQALATFNMLAQEKPGPFTAEQRQSFKAAALALIPTDGQAAEITETSGRSPIANAESYTSNVSYVFYGQKFSIRVTYVNLEKSCLQVICSAPQAKFEPFVKTLDGSLFSWHWVDAK